MFIIKFSKSKKSKNNNNKKNKNKNKTESPKITELSSNSCFATVAMKAQEV